MTKGFVLWTRQEIMVAVYFISRGLTEAAVSDILRARGYQRSTSAVRCKIKDIVRQNGGLQDAQHEWRIHAVDYWLDSQGLPHNVVSQVIGPTAKDVAAIEKVWVTPTAVDLVNRETPPSMKFPLLS